MASPSWPPPQGLSTKVVSRKDAVLTSSASAHIAAPASQVFEALLRVDQYHKWNTWMPGSEIVRQENPEYAGDLTRMHVGAILNFPAIMDAKKPDKTMDTGLQVTDISTPGRPTEYISKDILETDGSFVAELTQVYRVAWALHGGFVARGLRSERFHEVIVTGENECEVRTWEVMGGILAHTVKWMYQATLKEKFKLWMSDLKTWCEKQHLERGGST